MPAKHQVLWFLFLQRGRSGCFAGANWARFAGLFEERSQLRLAFPQWIGEGLGNLRPCGEDLGQWRGGLERVLHLMQQEVEFAPRARRVPPPPCGSPRGK